MRNLPYNNDLKQRARFFRNNLTKPKNKIWHFLKKLKTRINRQKPINNFIVDFYCAKAKLIIEIDGDSHFNEDGKAYDEERTKVLEGYGLKLSDLPTQM